MVHLFSTGLLILSMHVLIVAQEIDPYKVLGHVKDMADQIKDYTADIEIEVDVDFIQIPVKHATIFFKTPDKIKFKSDEFFMIPKRGFKNVYRDLLNSNYSAIYAGDEWIDDKAQYIIKIIPLEKKPDVIMATWWIDTANYTISKIESHTRNDGTYMIDFDYNNPDIPLPSMMLISFEIEEMKIPLKFIGKSTGRELEQLNTEDKQTGKVYLRFSNYVINSKLEDTIFDETN